MADGSAAPLTYSRQAIDVQGCVDVPGVAARLAAMGGVVAVNLGRWRWHERRGVRPAHPGGIGSAARSDGRGDDSGGDFIAILSNKLALTEREALALRFRLRTDFLAHLARETSAVQHHIEQTLLLLDGFSLQRPAAPVTAVVALVEARQSWLQALAAADHVLAMDAPSSTRSCRRCSD